MHHTDPGINEPLTVTVATRGAMGAIQVHLIAVKARTRVFRLTETIASILYPSL